MFPSQRIIEDLIALEAIGKDLSEKQITVADIINTYQRPTEVEELSTGLTVDHNISHVIGEVSEDPVTQIALRSWPQFLLSVEFLKWKSDRKRTVIRFCDTVEELPADPRESYGSTTFESFNLPSIENLDLEFKKITLDQAWLAALLISVESLPLCISVASAQAGDDGFPLIYVNKFFEDTTGYSREEILGRNCKFLQKGPKPGQTAQASSMSRLRENLGEGKPVKVVITNYRKDGTPFMNLLALKPIFDHNDDYAFVVGIQFDIGDGNASPERLMMVENIINRLPDKLTPKVEDSTTNNTASPVTPSSRRLSLI